MFGSISTNKSLARDILTVFTNNIIADALMGCPCSIQRPPYSDISEEEKKEAQDPPSRKMFIVQGLIGVGGFGKVWATTLQQTGKWYAVKEINKVDLMKHKSGHAMIFGELDALSRVEQHPFIVSLHLAYHDRRNCYLVMDLKTGGDLRYYLRKKMIFEERDVAFYVACISSALHHIHSKGMLHRDIKPENIILDELGWPHLTDFGVAHVHDPNNAQFGNTLTSTLASGTKQYLAPEVFCKAHIHGPESDYWALAVVAYELLHAKRPFEKHCSIQFITYLERGLSVKRKQVKEIKMRDLIQSRSTGSLSLSSEITDVGAYNAPFFAPNSPGNVHASMDAPHSPLRVSSPSMSFSGSTSRESNSAAYPGINVRTGSFDHLPGNGSASQDEEHGYCSSVQYTPVQTTSTSHMRRGIAGAGSASLNGVASGSGFNSAASSRPSSRNSSSRGFSTPGGTELEVSAETSVLDDPHQMTLLAVHQANMHKSSDRLEGVLLNGATRPATVGSARGIGFNAEAPAAKSTSHLPALASPSGDGACASPPRHVKVKQGSFLPPTAAGASAGSPLKVLLQQQQQVQQQFSCNQKNPIAQHGDHTDCTCGESQSLRVPAGDHWAVDEDLVMPADLRVHIPSSNVWLGKISHECVGFLKSMFDIRPSHRLSSRDIDALRKHPWMQVNGLSDWTELHKLNYAPNFKPGKRFMKETFADVSNTMLMGAGNVLHDPDGDSSCDNYVGSTQHRTMEYLNNGMNGPDDSADGTGGVLTVEQRASFRGFRYTAQHFQGLFRNQEPPLSTAGAASLTSMGNTATGTGTSTSSGKNHTFKSVVV